MSIQLIITSLQQYKLSRKTRILAKKYPFELKPRIAYIDNLILQLNHMNVKQTVYDLKLIADDIRHCLQQNYYPLLPTEEEVDNFNFANTLEDVLQLIELEATVNNVYNISSKFAESKTSLYAT